MRRRPRAIGPTTVRRHENPRHAHAIHHHRLHRRRAGCRIHESHRNPAAQPARTRAWPVHRRIAQGHRPRARRGPRTDLAAGRRAVDRRHVTDLRRRRQTVGNGHPRIRGLPRATAPAHRIPPPPRGAFGDAALAAAERRGDMPRRSPRGGHGEHRRPHQRGRTDALGGRVGCRRGAGHPVVRRPAVPARRARVHGHRLPDTVDAHRRRRQAFSGRAEDWRNCARWDSPRWRWR